MLFEILRYLSVEKINLGGGEFAITPTAVGAEANARFELLIEVADTAELEQCLEAVKKLTDVLGAERLLKLPAKLVGEEQK